MRRWRAQELGYELPITKNEVFAQRPLENEILRAGGGFFQELEPQLHDCAVHTSKNDRKCVCRQSFLRVFIQAGSGERSKNEESGRGVLYNTIGYGGARYSCRHFVRFYVRQHLTAYLHGG